MALKLYKRGDYWHYRGTISGRLIRGTTGTEDKKIAERIKADVEAQAWRSHLDGPRAHVTFAQAAIKYRNAGKSTRFLEPVEDHWKDTRIADITGEDIREAGRKLYPDAGKATWNRQVIAPTQAIINYAAEHKLCPHIKVKRFKVVTKRKVPATLEWVEAFVDQARCDGLDELAALCLFMFGTAARISEALRVTWRDVDLDAKTVELSGNKPEPWERDAHLSPPVFQALCNLQSNRNPTELVFGYPARDSVDKTWRNVTKRAGIKALTPHCCRHGFATSLLQQGYDVATVAEKGGWKDAATVLRSYAHALKDKTITDDLFRTKSTQADDPKIVTIENRRRKKE